MRRCKADGPLNAPIMIVGEAPGDTELEEGRGFVGASGRVLWSSLKRAGIHRHMCRITNVFQGEPELKSGQPSARQVAAEWDRLDEELAASKAKVLVLVGGVSLRRVTGIKKGIQSMRGYVLRPQDCQPVLRRQPVQIGVYKTSRKGSYQKGDPKYAVRRVPVPPTLPPKCEWIISLLHPAGVMRTGFRSAPALRADCDRVGRLYRDEVNLIDTVHFSEHMIPIEDKSVAWDIETDGDTITRLGVSGAGRTWTSIITPAVVGYVRRTLLDPEYTIICHNAAFDIPRLCNLVSLDMREIMASIKDTMLAAQLLCPDLPKGLEKASTLYLDLTPWKDSAHDDMPAYNAKDAYVTRCLDDCQSLHIESMGMGPELDAVFHCMPVLWRATQRGIRVQKDAARDWAKGLAAQLHEAVEQWPFPDVQLSSAPQLCSLLYGRLKLPPQWGKKGSLTVAEEALEELRVVAPEKAPIFDHILRYREAAGNLAIWGSIPERVHPAYLPSLKEEKGIGQGAATGRIQARSPNIMNLPKDARSLIIPDEGYYLGYADWAQAEAWVEATLFGDEALKEALRKDLHAYISETQGIERVLAKNFWYGSGRGAGPTKLRQVMIAKGYTDMTVERCRTFQQKLKTMFPQWAAGRRAVTEEAKQRRFCRNPFGRMRVYFAEPSLPDVVGFLIQSTVASMFIRMLVEVDPLIELLAPYHDAVLFQSRDEKAAEKVVAVMQREYPEVAPGFALRSDCKTSTTSWAEAS